MRNTLPSYKSPGGKELAARESESLGGGRLACFCVVMLAESLAGWLETRAGIAPESPCGGFASQTLLCETAWKQAASRQHICCWRGRAKAVHWLAGREAAAGALRSLLAPSCNKGPEQCLGMPAEGPARTWRSACPEDGR